MAKWDVCSWGTRDEPHYICLSLGPSQLMVGYRLQGMGSTQGQADDADSGGILGPSPCTLFDLLDPSLNLLANQSIESAAHAET